MDEVTAPVQARVPSFDLSKWLNLATRRNLFWACFALTLVVYTSLQFWNLPERRDPANWDYFSQVIARGGVPYRDVVNIKTPLSAYIGAAAIVVTRPFGLRDIYAIRITYLLLAALTIAFTFLVASHFFDSLRIGVLAAFILLGIDQFALLNLAGVQPKTPMVLFGLMTLWAIIKDRPFAAGLFGMLSALSWQPGLLFMGAAGLAFSRYFTSWRDMKVVKILKGARIPLILLLLHLWLGGALRAFFQWCFHYPFNVYAPRDFTTSEGFFDRLTEILGQFYKNDRVYFYLAIAGLLLAVAREAREGVQGGGKALLQFAPRHQLIIAALVYFAFCRIDMQGEQDLLPLLPFVAIFAAVMIVYSLDGVMRLATKRQGMVSRTALQGVGFGLACAAILVQGPAGVMRMKTPSKQLQVQLADTAEIVSHLEPGDQIYVHGQSEILVLAGLTNARKYTNLDHGKDIYLDQVEPGGFNGWLEQLMSDRPKVVVLERNKNLDRKRAFIRWVRADYERRRGQVFTYYIRKDAPSPDPEYAAPTPPADRR